MQFDDTRPIYLQIVDWICRQIIEQSWQADQRIPSVRDLGATLEVNPNTCMRSYEWLQERGIIYNKRGIGYFVTPEARQIVRTLQRKAFFDQWLPELYRKMQHLDIDITEIITGYHAQRAEQEQERFDEKCHTASVETV